MDATTLQAIEKELADEKQYSRDLEKQLALTHSKMEKLQRENSLIGKGIIAFVIGAAIAIFFYTK